MNNISKNLSKHSGIRLTHSQMSQIDRLLKEPENKGVSQSHLIRYLLDLGLTVASNKELLEETHNQMRYQRSPQVAEEVEG